MKQTTNYFAVLSLDERDEGEDGEGEKENSPPGNPARPPTFGSPLVDSLPPELRLKIFGFVLLAPCSVGNVGHVPVWKRGRRLNTSLFAVSRKVSAEALEVFYKGNVIRAKSLNDPYHTRPLTRHLELVGDIVKRMVLWRGSSATNAAMTARTNISELRTLSLAIDCVYDGSLPPITPSEVRSIESARLSKSHPTQMPRMVDYGVTEEVARPPSKLRVFFKRFDLIDAVAHARSLDPELSLEELDERYEEGVKQKSFRQIAVTLFALRMACLEAVRAKADLDEDQQRIVDQHLWISPHRRVEVDVLLAQAPSETRLLDLTVEKVGQDVFKRADDLVGDLLPLPPRWR